MNSTGYIAKRVYGQDLRSKPIVSLRLLFRVLLKLGIKSANSVEMVIGWNTDRIRRVVALYGRCMCFPP